MRLTERPSWEASAPCASADPDTWFPEIGDNGHAAKRICAHCPFKAPCLIGALERQEAHGIWGGVAINQYRNGRGQKVAA